MFELADAVHLSCSGLTRLVDLLECEGLLERRRGTTDPRQVFAAITERGLQRLAQALTWAYQPPLSSLPMMVLLSGSDGTLRRRG